MARFPMFRSAVRRRTVLVAGSLVALALGVGPSSAWVGTDQPDYAPGSTVTISGDNSDRVGYQPGETVHVSVTGPNGYAATCDGTAGVDGAWSCQVTLDPTGAAVGDYAYTATGAASGTHETGTFSDSTIATFANAARTVARTVFVRGDTVFATGTFTNAASIRYRFQVTNPSGGTTTTGCLTRSGATANDNFPLPANGPLSAASAWTYTFAEWTSATCSGGTSAPAGNGSFRVAQAYAFDNPTDRNNCTAESSPGTPCTNALTTFAPGDTVYVRVLGYTPSITDVSTQWNKPAGANCVNSADPDRPDSDANGLLATAYPPIANSESPNNAATCVPTTAAQVGMWQLGLQGPTATTAVQLNAFTVQKLTSSSAIAFHKGSHVPVSTVIAYDTLVHLAGAVTGQPSRPTPTGTFTVAVYPQPNCQGTPLNSNSGTLNASATFDASGSQFTLPPGKYSAGLHYNGDGIYDVSDGCANITAVNATVSITPDGTNRVNGMHTFTLHVQTDDGTGLVDAPNGTPIEASIDSGPGTLGTPNPCMTSGGTGTCQVTLSSGTTGVTKVSAHTIVNVSGLNVHRDTDNLNGNSGVATKRWVDARISIAGDGTDEVGHAQTVTATLEKDIGDGNGFVPAAGESVTIGCGTNRAALTTGGVFTGTTGAAGTFQASINSSIAQLATCNASSTLSVAGSSPFAVSTSAPSLKTWVDASIVVSPVDTTNQVNTNVPLTVTVTVDDGTNPPAAAPAGTVVSFSKQSGPGNFIGPDSCSTVGTTGACSVTVTSSALGTAYYRASTNLTFLGVPLARATGDGHTGDGADSKTVWVDTIPPVTTFSLDPVNPDVNGWYVFAVRPTVSATDVGLGVAQTHCQLDGTAPADYDALALAHPEPCVYLAPSAWAMTEGVHTLYAASIDLANNKETPVKTIVFKIDKTGPTSSVTPLAQFQGAGTFPVAWSGTDNLSGVANYDVRYRQAASNGTFGSYTTWLTHTTSTGGSFTAPAGSTTCFSVRATDVAGWTTVAWSPEQCTTVPLDDPALTPTGFWSTVTATGYYGPGVRRSTAIGNSLSAAVRGQTMAVLVTKQPGGGQVQLRWNGITQATVSLSSASTLKQQLVTFTLPSVQTGTLAIVQTGAGTVDVDGAGAHKTS